MFIRFFPRQLLHQTRYGQFPTKTVAKAAISLITSVNETDSLNHGLHPQSLRARP